jgi:hypothetical protein
VIGLGDRPAPSPESGQQGLGPDRPLPDAHQQWRAGRQIGVDARTEPDQAVGLAQRKLVALLGLQTMRQATSPAIYDADGRLAGSEAQ